MPWVKIDEQFPRHPKVAAAGPLGMALQVAALCYCNEYLTDGFIPESIAETLLNVKGICVRMWSNGMFGGAEDATGELIVRDVLDAGLWVEVPGGYQIHNYFDYQPSKAEVLAIRKTRAEAGRKGGQAKGQANGKHDA